jgi:formylglycine-generating enzyme required for sulfatase activity
MGRKSSARRHTQTREVGCICPETPLIKRGVKKLHDEHCEVSLPAATSRLGYRWPFALLTALALLACGGPGELTPGPVEPAGAADPAGSAGPAEPPALTAAATPAQDETTAAEAPPQSPPEQPGRAPSKDHFFRPGEWRRQAGRWVWQAGRWEPKQAGRFWISSRWMQQGERWVLAAGRWKDELPLCAPTPIEPAAVKMVKIPAGKFSMGSSAGEPNEAPAHEVAVAAFSIDATEVTVAAYAACIKAGKCREPGTGEFCTFGRCGREGHPVNCVDNIMAREYCAFAGKRLPTEEEWEYAARGSDGRRFPWGSDGRADRMCKERWGEGTCAAGAQAADVSPFGALDIGGNVGEWTSSKDCDYKGSCSEVPNFETRMVRGDSWGYGAAKPSTWRMAAWSEAQSDNIGFRCAKSN